MEEKRLDYVNLQEYSHFSEASHDAGLLQDAGFAPRIRKVEEENSDEGFVLLLQVPRKSAREAYRLLSEYYESEKDEVFELFGDWDVGGD